MVKRQTDVGRLGATPGDDGPVGAEPESKARRKNNVPIRQFPSFSHLQKDQEKKRFMRSRVASRAVYSQRGEFMKPVALIFHHRGYQRERLA